MLRNTLKILIIIDIFKKKVLTSNFLSSEATTVMNKRNFNLVKDCHYLFF